MSVTMVVGPKGSGKTLFVSWRLYRHHKRGFNVRSNYSLFFPHEKISSADVKAWALGGQELNSSAIGLDEIHNFFDARDSYKNKVRTYFVLQCRKARVHLLGTTQKLRQVDVRIRENLDYVVKARWMNRRETDPGKFVFRYVVHDMADDVDLPPFYLRGRNFYSLYDTAERILDFGDDDTKPAPEAFIATAGTKLAKKKKKKKSPKKHLEKRKA